METLNSLDTLASKLLEQSPQLMESGTLYANDLFNRFVMYGLVENYIYLSVGVVLSVLAGFLFRFGYKKTTDNDSFSGDKEFGVLCMAISIVIMFLWVSIFVVSVVTSLIQLHFVPELYLLEYFK